jgi:hypothetical protein
VKKAASRAFQRFTTPDDTLKQAGDAAEDPPVKTAASYGKGQVKGKLKSWLRDPLLRRLSTGFGVLLPAVGVFFSAKAVVSDLQRLRDAHRRTGGAPKVSGAYATAAAADGALLWAAATGLAKAIQEHVPRDVPVVDGRMLHWSAHYFETFLGLPPHLAPGLAFAGTLAALSGQVWETHGSFRQAAHDLFPRAAAQAEAHAEHIAAGQASPEQAAAAARQVANTAIEEVAPNLLEEPAVAEDVGKAIGEVEVAPPSKGKQDTRSDVAAAAATGARSSAPAQDQPEEGGVTGAFVGAVKEAAHTLEEEAQRAEKESAPSTLR